MQYNPMFDEGKVTNPMTNDELFWKHERHCAICSQHPQSVASFHYEPMCPIGRSYAEALGMFKSYGAPAIAGFNFYIQDAAGLGDETQINVWRMFANSPAPRRMQAIQT